MSCKIYHVVVDTIPNQHQIRLAFNRNLQWQMKRFTMEGVTSKLVVYAIQGEHLTPHVIIHLGRGGFFCHIVAKS